MNNILLLRRKRILTKEQVRTEDHSYKDLETFLKAKHNLSKCKVIYTDIGTIDVLVDNGLEDFLYWIDNSVVDFLGDDYVLSLVYTFEEYEDCIN